VSDRKAKLQISRERATSSGLLALGKLSNATLKAKKKTKKNDKSQNTCEHSLKAFALGSNQTSVGCFPPQSFYFILGFLPPIRLLFDLFFPSISP